MPISTANASRPSLRSWRRDRIVLCREPPSHAPPRRRFRGLPHLLFNGTMASPPGHPFWLHLLSYLPKLAHAKDVLDATGPCVLTSAQISFPDQDSLVIHPSDLFAPLDSKGRPDREKEPGSLGPCPSIIGPAHGGSPQRKREMAERAAPGILPARHHPDTRRAADPDQAARRRGRSGGSVGAPPTGEAMSPCLCRFAMRPTTSLLFSTRCRRSTIRRTASSLSSARATARMEAGNGCRRPSRRLRSSYRDIVLLQKHLGTKLDRAKRAKPKLQREPAERPCQGAQSPDRPRPGRERRLGAVDRHRCLEISRRHRSDADRRGTQDRRAQLREDRRRRQFRPQQLRDDPARAGLPLLSFNDRRTLPAACEFPRTPPPERCPPSREDRTRRGRRHHAAGRCRRCTGAGSVSRNSPTAI